MSLPARYPWTRRRGFSLIELMIAVAILAIIVSVALPSFMDSIRKGRRAEGIGAIAAVQQAQERWRGANTAYTNNLSEAANGTPPGLGIPLTTANGRYTLNLNGTATFTAYVITATAAGSQADDTRCAVMAARQVGGQLSYGSSATSTVDWADANGCWAK